MKIALRSTATVGKNPELDSARKSMFRLVGSVLSSGNPLLNNTGAVEIHPLELVALAKEVYDTKEVLLKTDEDSLPTLLANIFYVFTNSTLIHSTYFPMAYNNNHEHILLSLLWQTTPSAPKDFALYEVYKSDEKDIQDISLRLVYHLTKSFVLFENAYYYHSFDKCNEYLSYMEKNKKLISETPVINLKDGFVASEQSYYQLHGMGLIIRALDEQKMKKEKEALDDMELFLDDAQKGGLDNELTWLVSAYVNINKEEYEKAIPALIKLEKSDKISGPEKQAITELLSYIKTRKKGSALNMFSDKLAFGKITFHLVMDRLKNAKQLTDLEKSKEGKKLVEVQKEMNDKTQYFDSAKNNLNADSLSNKAKNLLQDVFK
ncbi:MAG: hypothetical protein H0U95_10545 [Bacteroidetes bacterium]|nr:hypothetical protein [Bacteroidota bacterium]